MATISSVAPSFLRRIRDLAVVFMLSATLSSCGDDVEPRTMEDILSEVEGTRLSAAETATLLDTANLLCGMDSDVLSKTLTGADAERLNFLDWVFSDHCPPKAGIYSKVLAESFPEHVQDSNG
jgi:hypothetical protein